MTSITDNIGLYRCPDYFKNKFSALGQFRKDGTLCDIELECGGRKFPAHRVVLAMTSLFFLEKFANQKSTTVPTVMKIEGIEASVLKQIISYMYTGDIWLTENNVRNIHLAAKLLRIEYIMEACCDYLQARLQINNCLDIQRFAKDYPHLLASTNEFINIHASELLQQNELLNLSGQDFGQLVFSNHLSVSEDEVFEALIRWIYHDKVNRENAGKLFCSRIRFNQLSRDKLLHGSEFNEFLTMYPSCKDDVFEALRLHLKSSEIEDPAPVEKRKVLMVFGGRDGDNQYLDSVKEFDFTTGLFKSSITLPKARSGFGVAVVADLVYVIGGEDETADLSTVDIYDAINNIWHSGPNMSKSRFSHGVAVLSGRIYVMGGYGSGWKNRLNLALDSAEVFDIRSNKWQSLPRMPGISGPCSAAELDEKIYVVQSCNVICFDPVSATWSKISEPTKRHFCSAVCALDNRLYVVGGDCRGIDYSKTAEVYSLASDSWQPVADMNVGRTEAGLVAHEGCLYVVGGYNKSDKYLDSIEKYDPTENTWTLLPNRMITGRSEAGVAVVERIE